MQKDHNKDGLTWLVRKGLVIKGLFGLLFKLTMSFCELGSEKMTRQDGPNRMEEPV